MGSSLQYCRSEQLLVFLEFSWKMMGAQLAFYLLPLSDPGILLEFDKGEVVCNPIRMEDGLNSWSCVFAIRTR